MQINAQSIFNKDTKNSNGVKKFSILLVLLIIIMPVLALAQTWVPIVPACGNTDQPECGFGHLIQMINNIINDLILLAIPVSAAVFAWAGFLLMTTAVADKKSEAKGMIRKVFIGLAIVLAAWLITNTLTTVLIKPGTAPDLIGR